MSSRVVRRVWMNSSEMTHIRICNRIDCRRGVLCGCCIFTFPWFLLPVCVRSVALSHTQSYAYTNNSQQKTCLTISRLIDMREMRVSLCCSLLKSRSKNYKNFFLVYSYPGQRMCREFIRTLEGLGYFFRWNITSIFPLLQHTRFFFTKLSLWRLHTFF